MTNYYELKPFSTELDLADFYAEAERRGHVNNANQKAMVDCFRNEDRAQVWILYKDNVAIGSVAAHTFPEMGLNAYRILTRTCVLEGVIPNNGKGLRTGRVYYQQLQNPISQFFVPKIIEWCGIDSEMYATSNQLDGGSQRKVHNIYFPLYEKQGLFTKVKEIHYRGTTQTVWKLNARTYLDHLSKHKWKDHVLL
jgi:hypothetical protein